VVGSLRFLRFRPNANRVRELIDGFWQSPVGGLEKLLPDWFTDRAAPRLLAQPHQRFWQASCHNKPDRTVCAAAAALRDWGLIGHPRATFGGTLSLCGGAG